MVTSVCVKVKGTENPYTPGEAPDVDAVMSVWYAKADKSLMASDPVP